MEQKLKQEKLIKTDMGDEDVILRALNTVEERPKVKNVIRRFECCYGQRPKKFFAFLPIST